MVSFFLSHELVIIIIMTLFCSWYNFRYHNEAKVYFITTVQIRPHKVFGPIVHTIVIGYVIFTVELGGGNRPMQAMQPLFQQLEILKI